MGFAGLQKPLRNRDGKSNGLILQVPPLREDVVQRAEQRFYGGGNSVAARPLNLSLAMICSIALAEERGALYKYGPLMVTPTGRISNG